MNKKDLIFDTALKLFVEDGFHGTATAKIAKEAGVANGTLFSYFKTKDELVIALYIHTKDELGEYLTKNATNKNGVKETMKAQFLASVFWALDNPVKFRFIQQFHNSPYLKQVEPEILEKQLLPHLSLIQKGIDESVMKPLPVEFLYSLISSHTFGSYQYLTSKEFSKAEQHDIIQKTFEMIWDMLT